LTTLAQVWSDPALIRLSKALRERDVQPSMAVVLGIRSARQEVPIDLSLPAFLQSYAANLVMAGVRLVPLGQTDGQIAIAALEKAVLLVAEEAKRMTAADLGSAGFMVDLASMAHETQYTRLFRS
jgi:urease accessory protein